MFSCLCLVITNSCNDVLDADPRGVLSESDVTTPQNVDGFVNAAYAAMGNDHYDTPYSLWPYGNVRSDDAYKGGSGTNDIQAFHFLEISNNVRSDFGEFDRLWSQNYVGIARTNKAISALNKLTETEYPLKKQRIAEMKFIRGHFYFMLKTLFKFIPYIDDTLPVDDYKTISNQKLMISNFGMQLLLILKRLQKIFLLHNPKLVARKKPLPTLIWLK